MAWYLNHYRHAKCRVGWTDEWSCCCNDRCPRCRFEIEPYDSDDLSILVMKNPDGGGWIVYVSPDYAEHDPDYEEHSFASEKLAREYASAMAEPSDLVESMSDLFDKMRANPSGDWRMADIETVCRRFGVRCIPPRGGGSHFKVSHASQPDVVVMPFRRPIKRVYIVKFVRYIEAVRDTHAQP